MLRALPEQGAYALRPTKTNEFSIFCICTTPPAMEQGRQQRANNSTEKRPDICEKNDNQKLFFKISAGTSQKSLKMTSWSLPGAPHGGGKCDPKWAQDAPRGPQDGPKSPPYNFQTPLFRPERPSEADLAPKTPQEDSRGPPGGRNLTCGASFGTHGRRFS